MNKIRKIPSQYTVRDIPPEADSRLREVAAMEEISLNQAVLRSIERGLGMTGQPVRYRSLRRMVAAAPKPDRKAWARTLEEMDRVNPVDWQ